MTGSALIAAALLALPAAAAKDPPPPADPRTATVHTEDADRFARLFAQTHGKPTAEQLRRAYLAPGSYGVAVFTPGRIRDADNLAAKIAADPAAYRTAIDTCLPVARQAGPELRAIYGKLHDLYPERPLPQIYIVFGAGNSGGTAGPGAQVLGLEVLCRIAPTPDKLRQALRMFFAHETVHTWQRDDGAYPANPLLVSVLKEGAADYVATLVTGAPTDAERDAWAAPREAELWDRLRADIALTDGVAWGALAPGTPAASALHRWVANYRNAPDGWPYELGYWMGMRIWQRYVAAAPDKAAAMRDVLDATDSAAILARGAYRPAPE